jgi:hydroxymethylbilane synthase
VFRWRPDVFVKDLRGNVDTRLRKLEEGEADALIIAAAGLLRLGVVPEHVAPMSLAEMVPAPGQGCLAVQARSSDAATIEALSALDHAPSRMALEAERGLMARLGGGCALPLGAFAEPNPRGVQMLAIALSPDGSRIARTEVDGATPEEVAELAALDLSAGGADEILGLVRP